MLRPRARAPVALASVKNAATMRPPGCGALYHQPCGAVSTSVDGSRPSRR